MKVHNRRAFLTSISSLAISAAFLSSNSADAARKRHKANASHKAANQQDLVSGPPAITPLGSFDTLAKWAFIMDYNTGTVLLNKAADERMTPSSLTKLMTIYIVFAMLRNGTIKLEQAMPVSEKAWRMQGSKMFVPLGGSVTVQELIQGVVIQSGNDACIVLAEGIAGSESQFVAMMNDLAPKMGLTNSHFLNTTGWPEEGHYMSARDVALVAYHLIHDYPEYYHFFAEREFRFNNITQGNRNVLVDKGLADGLKTGHTEIGGFGLCASSERNGRRVIISLNGMPSSNARAHEGERLLEWAFVQFQNVTLFHKDDVLDNAEVWMGAQPTVPLVAGQDLVMTLPNGWERRMQISLDYNAPIAAPVTKGQPVMASLSVQNSGGSSIQVPVVAGESVPKANIFSRIFRNLGHRVGRS